MIRLSILLIFLLLISSGCTNDKWKNLENPVKRGVLDLRNEDISDRIVPLRGEWLVKWNSLDLSYAHVPVESSHRVTSPVPHFWSWNGPESFRNNDGHGYATFHLTIQLPDDEKYKNNTYLLTFPKISSSYRLFVRYQNEREYYLVASGGAPGKSRITTIPSIQSARVDLKHSPGIEVLLEISNFHTSRGGIVETPDFGIKDTMVTWQDLEQRFIFFIFGTLIAMGIYHLLIFFRQKKNISFMWFGLFSLSIGIRSIIIKHYVHDFLPDTILIFDIIEKLKFLTFYLGMVFFIQFFVTRYPERMKGIFIRYVQFIILVLSLVVLILPSYIYSSTQPLAFIITMILIPYLSYKTLPVLMHNINFNNILTFTGYFILGVTLFHDILAQTHLIHNTVYFHYALFLFMMLQASVLAMENTTAWHESRSLSRQLMEQSDKTTSELELQKNIYREREKATFREKDMARDIQQSLLPEIPAYINDIQIDGYIESRDQMGGDFFDIVEKKDGVIYVLLADALGYGVQAAFQSALARLTFSDAIQKNHYPSEIMQNANKTLFNVSSTSGYMSAILLSIDQNRNVIFSNAAHRNPVILQKKSDTAVELKLPRSSPLGGIAMESAPYSDRSMQLEKGDRILIYSNGFVQQKSHSHRIFGIDGIIQTLSKTKGLSFTRAHRHILDTWKGLRPASNITDDASMILIEL